MPLVQSHRQFIPIHFIIHTIDKILHYIKTFPRRQRFYRQYPVTILRITTHVFYSRYSGLFIKIKVPFSAK